MISASVTFSHKGYTELFYFRKQFVKLYISIRNRKKSSWI